MKELCELPIEEYAECMPVTLVEDNGRLYIKALNEAGYNCTMLDVENLIGAFPLIVRNWVEWGRAYWHEAACPKCQQGTNEAAVQEARSENERLRGLLKRAWSQLTEYNYRDTVAARIRVELDEE